MCLEFSILCHYHTLSLYLYLLSTGRRKIKIFPYNITSTYTQSRFSMTLNRQNCITHSFTHTHTYSQYSGLIFHSHFTNTGTSFSFFNQNFRHFHSYLTKLLSFPITITIMLYLHYVRCSPISHNNTAQHFFSPQWTV